MSRESRMGVGVSGAASAGDCFGGMALAGGCVDWVAASGRGGVASDGESFAARVGLGSREIERGWRQLGGVRGGFVFYYHRCLDGIIFLSMIIAQ